MSKIIFKKGKIIAWDLSIELEGFFKMFGIFSRAKLNFPPKRCLNEKKKIIKERLSKVKDLHQRCHICPQQCQINRRCSKLRCKPNEKDTYFKESILISEEQIISPTYTVFFQGCNLSCIYCQVHNEVWDKEFAKEYRPAEIAFWVNRAPKAKTFSFNGGEPTCNIFAALETILYLKKEIPIVWKTNMYVSQEILDLLEGIVDVYVIDFKASLPCSNYITGKHDYFDVISSNFEYLVSSQREALFIVRHLQLPGHLECCTKPIFEWLRPFATVFCLSLPDYFPCHRALKDPNLNRLVSQKERQKAYELAQKMGFRLVF